MAIYAFGVQNVRKTGATSATGVKDAPIALPIFSTLDSGSVPTLAQCKVVVAEMLPNIDEVRRNAIAALFVAAQVNGTVRADETTGAGLFRVGKATYQLGVGYHASVAATAIASVNWKNIA